MSARSGLIGKSNSRAHLWQFQTNFAMERKNPKADKKCLFSLVSQWALFTRFGVIQLYLAGLVAAMNFGGDVCREISNTHIVSALPLPPRHHHLQHQVAAKEPRLGG